MSTNDTFEKVEAIIKEQLTQVKTGGKKVTLDSKFIEDLGADSLDTVEMIMAFEETFNIEIVDKDAEKMKTVQDVVDYINQHLASK